MTPTNRCIFDYQIYLLLDPDDGKVHYVGMSEEPNKRVDRFLEELSAKGPSRPILDWISSLKEQDKRPTVKVIERGYVYREKFWIRYFARRQPIKNIVHHPHLMKRKAGNTFVWEKRPVHD